MSNILLSVNLLKHLEEVVPTRLPDPSWTDRQIWIYVGKRQTVDLIKELLKEADEEIPEVLSSQF